MPPAVVRQTDAVAIREGDEQCSQPLMPRRIPPLIEGPYPLRQRFSGGSIVAGPGQDLPKLIFCTPVRIG